MKKTVLTVLITMLVCAAILFAGINIGQKKQDNHIDSASLSASLNDVQQLVTVEYDYTNMAIYDSSKQINGWNIPFTNSKFILTYDGVIKAGLDFSALQIEVNEKVITVTLPEPIIIAHEIDENSVQIMDEKYSIFNMVKVDDYTQFKKDQQAIMEEKALAKGLLEKARENGKEVIESMIINLVGSDCQIVFK